MDSFDKKHELMSQLIAMLKKSAADEVNSGLEKPEGEGDMHGIQVEKVEVLPEHEMDEPTPEHSVITKELSNGGVVPMAKEGQPEGEGSAHEEATESEAEREDEGDIEPMFTSLFGKKRKK